VESDQLAANEWILQKDFHLLHLYFMQNSWKVYAKPNEDMKNGIDYFYAVLPLGNPPQVMDVIIDSKSDLTYVPCKDLCQTCGPHTHPYFDFKKSKTYSKITCPDDWCKNRTCSNQTFRCEFKVQYAGESSVEGNWIKESLTMEDEHLLDAIIGCSVTENGDPFFRVVDGVLGISNTPDDTSLPTQILKQHPEFEDTFNLCFARDEGFIHFGQDKIAPNIHYSELHRGDCHPELYKFKTKSIELNGQILLPEGHDAYESKEFCGTVLDTGSPEIKIGNDALWREYSRILQKQMRMTKDIDGGIKEEVDLFHITRASPNICYSGADPAVIIVAIPQLTFYFGDDLEFHVPIENLVEITKENHVCINVFHQGEGISIGSSAIQNHYISIDRTNNKIGIAPIDCKKFDSYSKRTKKIFKITSKF